MTSEDDEYVGGNDGDVGPNLPPSDDRRRAPPPPPPPPPSSSSSEYYNDAPSSSSPPNNFTPKDDNEGGPDDITALVPDARDAPLPDLRSKKGTAFPEEDDPPLVTRDPGGKSNATDACGKEDAEYDDNIEAPSPPEMMAARFERGGSSKKMILDGEEDDDDIDDDIEAPPPPEMMAARFERGGSSKKMKLDGEEDDDIEDEEGAPRPPDMIAASFEDIDAVDRRREANEKAVPLETNGISDGAERMIMACDEWAEGEEVRIKGEIGRAREIDDDGTSAIVYAPEGRVDPSSLLDRTHYAAPNERCGASTNIQTQRDRDDEASHAADGGVHADITIHTNYKGNAISPISLRPWLSAIDPRDRSLPLLEAARTRFVQRADLHLRQYECPRRRRAYGVRCRSGEAWVV